MVEVLREPICPQEYLYAGLPNNPVGTISCEFREHMIQSGGSEPNKGEVGNVGTNMGK